MYIGVGFEYGKTIFEDFLNADTTIVVEDLTRKLKFEIETVEAICMCAKVQVDP